LGSASRGSEHRHNRCLPVLAQSRLATRSIIAISFILQKPYLGTHSAASLSCGPKNSATNFEQPPSFGLRDRGDWEIDGGRRGKGTSLGMRERIFVVLHCSQSSKVEDLC